MGGLLIQETGFNRRDFLTELALAVVAIAGGFLTVRSHPVAHDLMRNPTITNELHRKGTMFQNRFMPTLDDPGNELFSGTFRDLILGLVADTATLFQPLQNSGPINRGDELHIRLDNFHCSASSLQSAG